MAAPHVSGIAALLCSMDDEFTGADLKAAILDSALPWEYSVGDTGYSGHRPFAPNALEYYFNDETPTYLGLELVRKDSDGWLVRITNSNDFAVFAAYNSKMCFKDDAKTFSGISDIVDTVIYANSAETVTISGNGVAGFITASVGFSTDEGNYRRISYANGLTESGTVYSMNSPSYNTVDVASYAQVISHPDYLTFTVKGKSNGKWTVWINNPNSFVVNVTYNSKMCFAGDAAGHEGCEDLMSVAVSAGSYESVTISTNGLAGYITARIDYCYRGFAYSKVTYANKLKTSGESASEYNNLIRYL